MEEIIILICFLICLGNIIYFILLVLPELIDKLRDMENKSFEKWKNKIYKDKVGRLSINDEIDLKGGLSLALKKDNNLF